MQKRPLSITIISWLFILFGSIALLSGVLPFVHMDAAQLAAELKSHWMVHLSRIVEIIGGVFMLYGHNWARWLMVAWILFHIVIGALHSPLQFVLHLVIFSVVLFFLFRRPASEFFTSHNRQEISGGRKLPFRGWQRVLRLLRG